MRRRRLLQAAAASGVAAVALPRDAGAVEPMKFPAGFLWGTATSSYQVEGRGERKADSIWDVFCRMPGKIKDSSNGDIADDHYHRYPEDIALMARAGIKAYRFSISWPRVLPNGVGEPDRTGLDFYSRLTDALLHAGIEPWVCLYHWDLPQALHERGGWTDRRIADWYADYAALIARTLGDRATRWVMLNEPSVHAILGWGLGEHAPGLKSRDAVFAVLHHQNLAQGRGIAALRAIGGGRFHCGAALSLQPARPADGLPANAAAAEMWDAVWNRANLDPPVYGRYPAPIAAAVEPLVKSDDLAQIKQKWDFIGVNYYSRMYQKADPGGVFGTAWGAAPPGTPHTAMGWPVEPDGLREILLDLRDHYGNPPVYITENGACFADTAGADGRIDDRQRIAFLRDHIAACHHALAEKSNLRGYFAWTLLDNFEWAHGYTAPFGLVQVDRASQKRTPKASFDWFSGLAHSNTLG